MNQVRTSRFIAHLSLAGLGMVAFAACSGEGLPGESFEETALQVAEEESAITGGNRVSQDEMDNENYAQSTLRFWPDGETWCTGTKLGPHRYLTAAHCVDDSWDGASIGMSNQLDGNSNAYNNLTIERIYLHPSWAGNAVTTESDVAIFDVVEETPDIPEFAHDQFDTRGFFPDEEWARSIGYGCDNTGNNDFTKQWGDFQAYSRSSLPDAQWATNEYNNNIISFTPALVLCPGDSGGPLIQTRGGHWRIVGVNSYRRDSTGQSGFARLGDLQQFLAHPEPPTRAECVSACNRDCTRNISSGSHTEGVGECIEQCSAGCEE